MFSAYLKFISAWNFSLAALSLASKKQGEVAEAYMSAETFKLKSMNFRISEHSIAIEL